MARSFNRSTVSKIVYATTGEFKAKWHGAWLTVNFKELNKFNSTWSYFEPNLTPHLEFNWVQNKSMCS